MQSADKWGERLHPIKPFLPTELDDFNIEWGSPDEWRARAEKIRGTAAQHALDVLVLYWKYAWNTARCPLLIPNLVEQAMGELGIGKRFWNLMLDNSETQLTIIGTQVMAYSGFYFAYEHFVTNCYTAITGDVSQKLLGFAAIKEALKQGFDAGIESQVWSDEAVERIRRVRNDLVHNGGWPSDRTKELAADMLVEDHLAITPNDIKEAYAELKKRVDILLDQKYPLLEHHG